MKFISPCDVRPVVLGVLVNACLVGNAALAAEPAWWTQQKSQCGLPSSLAYNNWDGRCNSAAGGNTALPNFDSERVRRAQEAAAIERQRQQEESERIEQERLAQEKRNREVREDAFIQDRDAAAKMLKGSPGSALSQLKGISNANSAGLRGSGFESGISSSNELKGSGQLDQPTGSKTAACPPSRDAMVVDACDAPSTLSKSVDSAIPNTPAGNRVRKGFEAIQKGDWTVALAWFRDARTKDPRDPGIERLVDLAEFTLEYRNRVKTPATAVNAPSAQQKTPTLEETRISTGGDQGFPKANSVELSAAQNLAAQRRAAAAFKKYVEKYGDQHILERVKIVQGARQGEGFTNQELKVQLQKALIDVRSHYRKMYPDGPPGSVGGSPAVEEIAIGGKG